jgi:hypothetical protein
MRYSKLLSTASMTEVGQHADGISEAFEEGFWFRETGR